MADHDGAGVAVSVPLPTANRSPTDPVSERQDRLLATAICLLFRLTSRAGVDAAQIEFAGRGSRWYRRR
jgi:hypothetical protein